jgi:hypothetical protein
MPVIPDQLFTIQTLGSFSGMVGATYTLTSTAQRAFNIGPAWLGLLIAECISLGTVSLVAATASDYVLAALNGCLVFLTAAGASNVAGAARQPSIPLTPRGLGETKVPKRPRAFLDPWLS